MKHRWMLGIAAAMVATGVVLPGAAQDEVLTVIAHDSFAYSEGVLEAFREATGIPVEVVRLGDTGTLVNQAILTRDVPLGDVLFGVDNTFVGRALDNDLFIPYESPELARVNETFIIDDQHRVTPIDYGDVCLNYDVAYFAANDLPVPASLLDLTDPQYAGLLVVQNPASSSPGLAFLLTTVAVFGEQGDYTYLDFWRDLAANDVFVADSWTDAYYGQFSGSGGSEGDRPLVVSYASSPPAEVFFADPVPDTAPTQAIVADESCFRQIEFAGILQGTDQLEAAQQFIDFLLSTTFQNDMPLNMFVYPVVNDAELPDVFVAYSAVPENPVTLEADVIEANRERWIQAWTETMLQS